jgi:hypothetical protein
VGDPLGPGLKRYPLNTNYANHIRRSSSQRSMRLVFLCLVAWLVLAVAALASGGVGSDSGGPGGAGPAIAN